MRIDAMTPDSRTTGTGFERRVVDAFAKLKSGAFGSQIISGRGRADLSIELYAFSSDQLENEETIRLLADWRAANIGGFTKVFPVTFETTRSWSKSQLIERSDRILFFLREPGGPLVGHVGLSSFNFTAGTCEIDNIVRGKANATGGIMQASIEILMDWLYTELVPGEVQLRVLNDNSRALALYHRLDFEPFLLQPLKRHVGDDFVEWIPAIGTDSFDRFLVAMRHIRRR
jgi:RimJ/RimL family protein N-acetyltransferase